MTDANQLQERINVALRASAEDYAHSSFSPYVDAAEDLTTALMKAAFGRYGADAVERALDEFERLASTADRVRLQHALNQFLTHRPAPASLGLRIPDLEERAPWMVTPSQREKT